MESKTPEDVRTEVLECLQEGMQGGGYVISTDHSIHDNIPTDNVFCLIDTVKKFGVY